MRRLTREFIVRHPWPILVGLALVWALVLARLVDPVSHEPRLALDPAIDSLLPRGGEALARYEQTRRRFGSDDLLLVAWFADDLFSPARLADLKRLSRRIERMPGVFDVDSLASAVIVRAEGEFTEVNAFLRTLPETAEQALSLREEALANPLYRGQLVADDGRGALIGVHFDPGLDAEAQFALVDAIAAASAEESNGVEQAVTGPLYLRLEISRLLFADLFRVMPVAVLCTVIVAGLGFRNVRGPLLPLLSNLLALSVTLAVFVEAGHALNFVTVILPPVIYVVGFAYAVHVVSGFERAYAATGERAAAVQSTLHAVFLPLTLTAFTTALGFASLALSTIVSVRVFGSYAAIGTLVAWVAAITLVPAALGVMPPPRSSRSAHAFGRRLAPALARFDLQHRGAIMVAAGVVVVASVLAASRIDVSTDYLEMFPPESTVRRDFERLGETFAGSVPLQILIESDIIDAFKAPRQLEIVDVLAEWLENQPEVGGVYTLADYIAILHEGLLPEEAAGRRLPRSASLTDQLLMLGGGNDIDRFADARFTSTVLHVRCNAVSTSELVALAERIEGRLSTLPPHLHGHVTGSSYIVAQTVDDITRGQATSLALALGAIYVVLVMLFGSLHTGALALLPNALPIAAFFGMLGATGVTLNLTTSLVAAIALGIAVDDTIHFLSRFNDEARKVADERAGVGAALAAVIRPVTFTTAALCAGFLSLLTGALQNQVQFGLLAAATLAFAWVADLVFTPALAGRLRFVTLWETLSVDLGASPEASIPLFAGLTERQARTAALMGVLRDHPRGSRVIELGDHERTVCVVIDGELRASLPSEDEGVDVELRRLRRGDLVGEIALFHGTRTANVDAETDVRVLNFSPACLDRLQRRYPRIGAQVYRNLGEILAERLADVTERL